MSSRVVVGVIAGDVLIAVMLVECLVDSWVVVGVLGETDFPVVLFPIPE